MHTHSQQDIPSNVYHFSHQIQSNQAAEQIETLKLKLKELEKQHSAAEVRTYILFAV